MGVSATSSNMSPLVSCLLLALFCVVHSGGISDSGDQEPKTGVPVDGFWSEWGDWNKCFGFVHVRKRQCNKTWSSVSNSSLFDNNPPPSNGGKSCPGAPLEAGPCQPETNSTLPHPVNGEWSEWGSWSSCHNNKRFRFRQCNNPPPKYGGFCLGRSFQEDDCGSAGNGDNSGFEKRARNKRECVTHMYAWTAWGEWGGCTKECPEVGHRERHRECREYTCSTDLAPGKCNPEPNTGWMDTDTTDCTPCI